MSKQFLSLCILAALLSALLSVAQSQEPAPTLQQCRVDGDAWQNRAEEAEKGRHAIAQPDSNTDTKQLEVATHYLKRFPLSEISRRSDEMASCTQIDPDNRAKYELVGVFLESEESNRYMNFLLRHKLWSEFVAEDAQGNR